MRVKVWLMPIIVPLRCGALQRHVWEFMLIQTPFCSLQIDRWSYPSKQKILISHTHKNTHTCVYIYIHTCVCVCVYIYTWCPRRNGQNFGGVFLMLKYTDITQNTYVQSWTVMEIKAREKCGLLAVPRSVPGSRDVIPIRCALSVLVYSRLSAFLAATAHVKCLVTLRTNMTWVRVFL